MLLLPNMFKFFVLGVFIWQTVVKDCYGQIQLDPYDIRPETLKEPILPPKNDSSDALILHKDGQYHIYASRLNLYLGGHFAEKRPNDLLSDNASRRLDPDYVATEGLGAHKLHIRKLSWGKARRICVDEGGHLAVIRTDAEEKILLGMLANNGVSRVWIGYHDITEENDWFSVLDEPLGKTGWARWSKNRSPNPREKGGRCTELVNEGGMTNEPCSEERSFVCKVSID